MLYQTYQMQDDLVAPLRLFARTMMSAAGTAFWGLGENVGRQLGAGLEMSRASNSPIRGRISASRR